MLNPYEDSKNLGKKGINQEESVNFLKFVY